MKKTVLFAGKEYPAGFLPSAHCEAAGEILYLCLFDSDGPDRPVPLLLDDHLLPEISGGVPAERAHLLAPEDSAEQLC